MLRVRIIALGIAHGPSCERIIDLWNHECLTLYAMSVLTRPKNKQGNRSTFSMSYDCDSSRFSLSIYSRNDVL